MMLVVINHDGAMFVRSTTFPVRALTWWHDFDSLDRRQIEQRMDDVEHFIWKYQHRPFCRACQQHDEDPEA